MYKNKTTLKFEHSRSQSPSILLAGAAFARGNEGLRRHRKFNLFHWLASERYNLEPEVKIAHTT